MDKNKNVEELENNLSSASANGNSPKKKRQWIWLAMVFLILGLAFLFMQLNKGGSYDKDFLIADNTLIYPSSDDPENEVAGLGTKAYLHYNKGNFRAAIKEFKILIAKDNDPKHKFYLAICFLETQKYKAAQKLLLDKKLKDNKMLPINFYLALSKIGTDDPKEAIELLSNPTLPTPILNKYREKLIRMLSR